MIGWRRVDGPKIHRVYCIYVVNGCGYTEALDERLQDFLGILLVLRWHDALRSGNTCRAQPWAGPAVLLCQNAIEEEMVRSSLKNKTECPCMRMRMSMRERSGLDVRHNTYMSVRG